jgi:hypothetical protein
MTNRDSSNLNRRHFLGYVALGTFGLLAKDLVYPASAMADNEVLNQKLLEKYHIFVPFTIARNGGNQTFTLRSGEPCQVEIPSKTQDSQQITIKGRGQDGKDITVVLHTLYDRQLRIADQVYQEIDTNTEFVEEASKTKCKSVYEEIEDGKYINDLIALDFLDYIISSSNLDSKIKDRYQLASTNSRLIGIENAIETALAQSQLTDIEKKLIRGTFGYVRAGEPVPDFKALTDIHSIVVSSALPLEIKQAYSLASANSRGLTVDFILVGLINDNQQLTPEEKTKYLSIYEQVRDGKTVEDEATLKSLDSFILNAKILENAKVVYLIARTQNLKNKEKNPEDFDKTVATVLQDTNDLLDLLQDVKKSKKQVNPKNQGSVFISQATKLLSNLGVETATGVSVGSLSGAAATNATLAVLGGGSVAAGGLGMLGGLVVVTGGAALIGAAGILSIALVSEMDSEDKKNLGVAISTGTVAGAATVLAAWTAASALGVTGTLSGAAAITTTISALGGLSLMTGGAALVASGTAFLIWSLLKAGKTREQSILHQLETRTYTYTEDTIPGDLGEIIKNNVSNKYQSENIFFAPNIPLDKLSSALSAWVSVYPDEKVIALIDTSGFWGNAGVVFTDGRLLWTNNSSEYQDLGRFVEMEKKLTALLSDDQQKQELSKLKKVVDILSDENYAKNFSELQELVAITSTDKQLETLVSNEDKNKLSKLKSAVDILSDKQYTQKFSKLKEVIDILSNEPELASFLPPQLVSQLSDEQYKKELFKLKEVVEMLSDESDRDKLTNLLREIGMKSSIV